jgi:hypothetical protein
MTAEIDRVHTTCLLYIILYPLCSLYKQACFHRGFFPSMSPSFTRNESAFRRPLDLPSELWIAGLGSQYPPHSITPSQFEKLASRFYDVESPG